MTELSDRVSKLEGAYEHLATKADIESVKGEIADLKGSFRTLLIGAAAVLGLLNIVLRFLPD